MTGEAPQFVRFVSAVEGRLATRWGGRTYFGAKVIPADQHKPGGPAIEWDTDRVYPLTDEFCRKYSREVVQAIQLGDLKERTRDEWEAYEAGRAEARKARAADSDADKAAAAAATEQAASDAGPEDAQSDAPDEATTKPARGGRSKKR